MNKRLASVLIFAFVISAAASLILYRLISAQLANNAKVAPNRVLVASHNLENGALIKDGDVRVADWGGPVPVGALLKPEDAIGRGVVQQIYEGEAILDSRIAARGAGAGLAATIPQGMRAVAVRVNDVSAVAGFVVPGMHVDLLIAGAPPGVNTGSTGTLTKTLMQNLEVISAGQSIQKDAEGKPINVGVVNMLVTPEQAETLSLASNETRIQLVLRNPTDKEIAKTPGTAVTNLWNGMKAAPAALQNGGGQTKKVAVKKAPPPPPPPVAPAPVPEKVVVPITVEVLHGASRSEARFKGEESQDQKNGSEAKP